MKEQDGAAMIKELPTADIFLYQPAGKMDPVPSTDDIVKFHLSERCSCVSFPYLYNHGFFPFLEAEGSFSAQLKYLLSTKVRNVFLEYNGGIINFECGRRFIECLAEQSKREQLMDVKMTDWILANYRKQKLFLSENHPTSATYVEITRRILVQLEIFEPKGMTWTDVNEVGMNGVMPLHDAVVKELGLEYQADPEAHNYYRYSLEKIINLPKVLK